MEDKIMIPAVRTQNWFPSIFSNLFDDDFFMPRTTGKTVPAVNIMEEDKAFKIQLAAPGMSKEDLNVSLDEDNNLVIAFEKKSENEEKGRKGTYLRREFSYSTFRQAFELPDNIEIENINASMNDGILNIELPKKDMSKEAPTTRQIEIQ